MTEKKIRGYDCPKCKKYEVYIECDDARLIEEQPMTIKHLKTYCRNCGYVFPEPEREDWYKGEKNETYSYLRFEELEAKPKTKQFAVKNKTSGFILGYVKWYAPWRKYCFFISQADLVFDASCLADIKDFIDKLMLERKTKGVENGKMASNKKMDI